MLGRLARLRFDQERALETDLVLVFDHQLHEAAKLIGFALEIGVEQRVVAFATAPQDVVFTAEGMRELKHGLDLGRRVGEHVGVGIRCRASRIARVAEQVGRAPEQLDAAFLHGAAHVFADGQQVLLRLGERLAFGGHIAVVEAVVGHGELLEELEGCRQFRPSGRHRIARAVGPGAIPGADAEDIRALRVERVPVADGEAQVLGHGLAQHGRIGIVVAERQRIGGVRAAVGDGVDVLEETHSVDSG